MIMCLLVLIFYRRNLMSKFIAVLALTLTFALSGNAIAQKASGGFQGPGIESTTVAEALKMDDDTIVIVVGKIERSLGNEKYLFKDNTGTIVVSIDDDDWNGVTVTPENTVELHGEVDKEIMKAPEIDVDRVILK